MYNDIIMIIMNRVFSLSKSPLWSAYWSLPQHLLPQLLLETTDLFTVFIILPFSECDTVGFIYIWLFQIDLFHLILCVSSSSVSLHGLKVPFFWELTILHLWIYHHLFIHLLEDNLVSSNTDALFRIKTNMLNSIRKEC